MSSPSTPSQSAQPAGDVGSRRRVPRRTLSDCWLFGAFFSLSTFCNRFSKTFSGKCLRNLDRLLTFARASAERDPSEKPEVAKPKSRRRLTFSEFSKQLVEKFVNSSSIHRFGRRTRNGCHPRVQLPYCLAIKRRCPDGRSLPCTNDEPCQTCRAT